MAVIRIVLLAIAVIGTLYYIISTLALVSYARQPRINASHLPRVSVLKTVCGQDSNARSNFLSFFAQDYPDYEVIFGVLDPNDPSVPLIAEITRDFPNASFHIGSKIAGSNNKVRILHDLAEHASGDILVMTDADVRVQPDFLRRMTAPFEDGSVGVVTCPYRGIEAQGIGDALEGLHMTCVFAPGVALNRCLGEIDFALGAAIAIRRDVLEAIGGFASIADYLADDFQLGRRAALAGYGVRLSDYVVEVALSGEKLRRTLARELRWARTIRASRPWGNVGLIFTYGFTYALLFLLASGFSKLGWAVFVGATAVRGISAFVGARVCLDDSEVVKRIYLLPIRDLLSFGVWATAYLSRTVTWRCRKLKILGDGRVESNG